MPPEDFKEVPKKSTHEPSDSADNLQDYRLSPDDLGMVALRMQFEAQLAPFKDQRDLARSPERFDEFMNVAFSKMSPNERQAYIHQQTEYVEKMKKTIASFREINGVPA